MTDDGLMNENAGNYKDQRRFDVRWKVQEDLKSKGLFVDKKDNPMKVPLCEKTKDVVRHTRGSVVLVLSSGANRNPNGRLNLL